MHLIETVQGLVITIPEDSWTRQVAAELAQSGTEHTIFSMDVPVKEGEVGVCGYDGLPVEGLEPTSAGVHVQIGVRRPPSSNGVKNRVSILGVGLSVAEAEQLLVALAAAITRARGQQ